ncbi:MAG: hypothetical protein H6709_01655 [Kofleriaceae bacterium]|nr:hypothetical protein [Kofleriaceae bacterium]MCB9570775.1 hypothetical protein [Kofleriaceae bacterium]
MTIAGELRDRFRILRMLGRSLHAEVFVARDVVTGRLTALKLLEPWFARRLAGAGRLGELEDLAMASPPGVVRIDAVGRTADAGAYVATRLHERQSLACRLASGALPCADAIRFCLDVGRALQAARARGVQHGGVKASNVFAVADPTQPRGERALLGDFATATPRSRGLAPLDDTRDLGALLHELVANEAYGGEGVPALIERGVPTAVAIVIAESGRTATLDDVVDALELIAATAAFDADPTETNLPLRPPPPPRRGAPELTTAFTRVDLDGVDVAA